VAERNRAFFLAKWQCLLERFLPPSEVAGGAGPLVARAAQEAARCREAWATRAPARPAPHGAAPLVDQPALERRCIEREHELRRAYVAFLEDRVAALERELTRAPARQPAPSDHQPP
jgi:hypothetical protein